MTTDIDSEGHGSNKHAIKSILFNIYSNLQFYKYTFDQL